MATVIKAGQSGHVLKRLSTVDLSDHLREARTVIEAARREAAEIVAAARAQAQADRHAAQEQARRDGLEQGLAEGRESGFAQAREDALRQFETQGRAVIDSFQLAVDGIERMKTDLVIAAERNLLEFAVSIARKLTLAIGQQFSDAAVENFRRSLAMVDARTNVAVRVHPDVLAALEMYAEHIVRPANPTRHVSLLADETLTPGGCCLSTERTEVDASLETQIDEMVRLILGDTNAEEVSSAFGAESNHLRDEDHADHA